jgi:serine/threonine protein kinase/AmiR/NasT family two-component response regulator
LENGAVLPATAKPKEERAYVESPGQELLQQLLSSGLVRKEDWEALPAWNQQRLSGAADVNRLLDQLLTQDLLTGYQAGRIRAQKPQWLILGNYRVLDRVGAGSLGVVFKAEHLETRDVVAIKILVPTVKQESSPFLSLLAQRQTIAQVQHANIARVLDVGEARSEDAECPLIYYYVMEFVTGTDLEQRVLAKGPLLVAQACDVAYQVAGALAAAHRHHLVHRDLKPSNILLADNGQAKLLDFGLIHSFNDALGGAPARPSRPEFLAPEQADSAAAVDIRSDLYSLGVTLYWALTAKVPFPVQISWHRALPERAKQTAPPLKEWGVEVPDLLQKLLDRLLAFHPQERPAEPGDVVQALAMLRPEGAPALEETVTGQLPEPASSCGMVLVIDADDDARALSKLALDQEGLATDAAGSAKAGLEMALAGRHDVVLVAADLPDISGLELLQYLRKHPPRPNQKIVVLCATVTPEAISQVLTAGADDYLTKPVDPDQLRMRVKTALHLKQAQDQARVVVAAAAAGVGGPGSNGNEPGGRQRRSGGWKRPLAWLFGA